MLYHSIWLSLHDDVIKWKHFPRYWPFVRGIHRSPVNSPHKGQWRGALMFSLICAWINGWVNNREAGDLRRHRAHYDVIVMMRWNDLTTLGLKLIINSNSLYYVTTVYRTTRTYICTTRADVCLQFQAYIKFLGKKWLPTNFQWTYSGVHIESSEVVDRSFSSIQIRVYQNFFHNFVSIDFNFPEILFKLTIVTLSKSSSMNSRHSQIHRRVLIFSSKRYLHSDDPRWIGWSQSYFLFKDFMYDCIYSHCTVYSHTL